MRFLALVFASSICTAANAAKINCDGDYAGYHVNIKASTQSHVVTGDIHIVITNGGKVVRQANLRADSSDVQIGKHIRANGHGKEGRGDINANYSARDGLDYGNLNVQTGMGDASIPMACSITGKTVFFNEFGSIDLEDYM